MQHKMLICYDGSASYERPGTWEGHQLLLPHPVTGQFSCFVLHGGCLQEVQWYNQHFGSWFVEDSVLQDGSLLMCTPVDVLFLLLPMLERGRQQKDEGAGRFCDAEQLLTSTVEHCPSCQQLIPLAHAALPAVCDVKQADGCSYFRVNQRKVLGWLCCKVELTQQALKASAGETFKDMDEVSLAGYSIAMLGEYISEAWQSKLRGAFGVPEQDAQTAAQSSQGRPATAGQEPKHQRLDPKEIARKRARDAVDEAKRAAKAKEAAGMRSISSFFAPSSKRRG